MKKTFLCCLMLLSVSMHFALAQDSLTYKPQYESVWGRGNKVVVRPVFSFIQETWSFRDHTLHNLGIEGGISFNNFHFGGYFAGTLGGGFNGIFVSPRTQTLLPLEFSYRHIGTMLGYDFAPHRLWHLTSSLKIGTGRARLNSNTGGIDLLEAEESFFEMIPELGGELNILPEMRLGARLGYRLANPINSSIFGTNSINAWQLGFYLRFTMADASTKKSAKKISPINTSAKIIQVGLAMSDASLTDTPYQCLHATAPMGTIIALTNKKTTKPLAVQVSGTLSEADRQKGVILRLSPVVMKQLGAKGESTEVEALYFDSK